MAKAQGRSYAVGFAVKRTLAQPVAGSGRNVECHLATDPDGGKYENQPTEIRPNGSAQRSQQGTSRVFPREWWTATKYHGSDPFGAGTVGTK